METKQLTIDYSQYIEMAAQDYVENGRYNRADIMKDAAAAYKTLNELHKELNTAMPCGHLARYAVNREDGTQYCSICAGDAYKLADKLTDFDNDQECPHCSKIEWGKEYHDPACPFAIAYDILDRRDGRK